MKQVSYQRIFATWWPLAGSWLLMAFEGPAQSAVVARLPAATVNLAAYGGVVFALALIIESPILMLLSASTALSKDWASYLRIRRFMMGAGAVLTALHILIAFTPLYDLIVVGVIGAPPEVVEPARTGLQIMLPWTWSIAYRRFHQGVLIRFGRSRAVGLGTLVRLGANLLVLITGYLAGSISGIVVATSAIIAGVLSEALYVGLVVRPILKNELRQSPPVDPALTWRSFSAFYVPLALTSLIGLLANPIGSAAVSRMPLALQSLAVYPVITGFTFMVRSLCISLNEVVVAHLDEKGSSPYLRRFTTVLALASSGFLFLFAVTPLSTVWFRQVVALSPDLADMAGKGIWLMMPMPALNALQSWYTGSIMHGRKTRGITEAVVVFLVSSAICLGIGAAWGKLEGLYVALGGMTLSTVVQTAWLWWRSRPVMSLVAERD